MSDVAIEPMEAASSADFGDEPAFEPTPATEGYPAALQRHPNKEHR